ncbi:helix-turn-helix domain-containing protein [Staphylococcus epidermidis]|uniref:helix-turn-helix domain-containing protein n=1 Tax=Staphylococcus epidermidis TaxID=1282 RepID=UPI001C40546E|nr:helix-turn-helix transcriptional regulator [Staphylococcus epidermidis]MCG1129268.1 helix-turn-helix transcriptional regulator [Staphylococcus epidermidis]MCG1168385.1 helix-turn-helix transcriptional regulator [Staphylococcus epidermidis]MCG1298532.1 helix-turn-helix transcriptional regulator [Staphylococcus epidermidis]MCG1362404.1 helix-turn-helix transcriptional regulator [Staphylococcus epidermidis]MCG1433396.1 helix-turn-helix transcriptional regulator [Staphylococcus epidermidis]
MLNLKELREKNGMSRYQLSKLTGLQNSTIVSAEIEIDNPAFLTVKKICDALEVDINKVKKIEKTT